MTVNRASKLFKVPRSTIQLKILRLSGKTTWGSRADKAGPEKAGSGSSPRDDTYSSRPVYSRQCEATPGEDQQQQNCSLLSDSEPG